MEFEIVKVLAKETGYEEECTRILLTTHVVGTLTGRIVRPPVGVEKKGRGVCRLVSVS